MKRCPKCIEHPGWEHPEETGKRSDPRDACRRCFGSGREQSNNVRRPEFRDEPSAMTLPGLVSELGDLKSRAWAPLGGSYAVKQAYHDRLCDVVTELEKRGAL